MWAEWKLKSAPCPVTSRPTTYIHHAVLRGQHIAFVTQGITGGFPTGADPFHPQCGRTTMRLLSSLLLGIYVFPDVLLLQCTTLWIHLHEMLAYSRRIPLSGIMGSQPLLEVWQPHTMATALQKWPRHYFLTPLKMNDTPMDVVKNEDLSFFSSHTNFPNYSQGTCYLWGRCGESLRIHTLLRFCFLCASMVLCIVQGTEKAKHVLCTHTTAFLF